MTTRATFLSPLALGLIAASAAPIAPAAAFTSPDPIAPPETNRHHRFVINLDGDRKREVIWVYNLDQTGTGPVTGYSVWNYVRPLWERTDIGTIYGPGPGAATSGLRQAWAGDFNRDGRKEIASRDSITPSAGEVLAILRQRRDRPLKFTLLQRITGDEVVLQRPPGERAVVRSRIKSNHSVDGAEHVEIWRWSARAKRWACREDCEGRPTT